ncbi:MAG: CheB methylesterase domain-containing protein [Planctomycetota bacterium]|jgi:two-component system chemotaxis response regulator CheB
MNDSLGVLIVDDSRIFRHLVEDALRHLNCHVAASVFSAAKALAELQRQPIGLVILDLDMPEGDSLDFIDTINSSIWNGARPLVIACNDGSTEQAVSALTRGALGVVDKPKGNDKREPFAHELTELIQAIATTPSAQQQPSSSVQASSSRLQIPSEDTGLVVIACSTGGPQALLELLPRLSRRVSCPICIVQHIPANFTASLASSLQRRCDGHHVIEAKDSTVLASDTTYIAPGNHHLILNDDPAGIRCQLSDDAPVNGCRPAADVTFASVARLKDHATVCVILTGMGDDGSHHLEELHRAGARILAQDETSSVVYGMPARAVATGYVDDVASLHDLPELIVTHLREARH